MSVATSVNALSATQQHVKTKVRFEGVDVLRGLIIVLMALDHTRDFWAPTLFQPEDIEHSNLAWFLTRWVTHLCAPLFVFLAGTSVWFQLQRSNKVEVSRFLISRGLWLVFLEVTINTLSWHIPDMPPNIVLQVIWILGVSMLLMAAFIWLPLWVMVSLSVIMITGHNLLDDYTNNAFWWSLLHQSMMFNGGDDSALVVMYPLIPWPAIMILGYLVGELYRGNKDELVNRLRVSALAMIVSFVVLRVLFTYGEPNAFLVYEDWQKTLMSFLNVTKYPPSLLYTLITLGVGLLLLSVVEQHSNKVTAIFKVFGRVPMFFYLLHIPVINLSAYYYNGLVYGQARNMLMGPDNWPDNYEPSLLKLYIVWLLLVVGLYFACKSYGAFKQARPHQWWWRYL